MWRSTRAERLAATLLPNLVVLAHVAVAFRVMVATGLTLRVRASALPPSAPR